LWAVKLQRALRLGAPKVYTSKTDRLARIRGDIDLIDHTLNHKRARFLCTYRQHSYNTPATALFIKAYEAISSFDFVIRHRSTYNAWQMANAGAKTNVRKLLATPEFSNPYYSDYNTLIAISKQLIRSGGAEFSPQSEASAYLFDISMLFEYFIRKQIKRSGVQLLTKTEAFTKTPRDSIGSASGRTRQLQPDIVWRQNDSLYVFDVKYKSFNAIDGVKREDLFQLHTYVGQLSNVESVAGVVLSILFLKKTG